VAARCPKLLVKKVTIMRDDLGEPNHTNRTYWVAKKIRRPDEGTGDAA
jgi:hypothetical protein